MNAVSKLSAIALVVSSGLFSCQKDQHLEPQASLGNHAEAAARQSNTYTLVKYGDATLSYYADGRLKQVTRGDQAVVTNRTDYSYGILQTKTTSYNAQSGPNRVGEEVVYHTDVNTGRCFESEHKKYSYLGAGVTVVDQKTWKYEYNAQGRLGKKYNKANAKERIDFSYNADGDLTQATHYDANGVAKTEETLVYAFVNAGETPKVDHNHLNPVAAGFPDEFLRIFGKTSPHLIRHMNSHSMPNGPAFWAYNYRYNLNAAGLVTQRKGEPTPYYAPPTVVDFGYLLTL